jgi:hypothetical protein
VKGPIREEGLEFPLDDASMFFLMPVIIENYAMGRYMIENGYFIQRMMTAYFDSALDLIKGMTEYFETYRIEGFSNSLNIAKAITKDLAVDTSFPGKRHPVRKKQFDESNSQKEIIEAERAFKVKYFFVLVDMAIASLRTRFEELLIFKGVFRFLELKHPVVIK